MRRRAATSCACCGLCVGDGYTPVAVVDRRTGERVELALCESCRDRPHATWRLHYWLIDAALVVLGEPER